MTITVSDDTGSLHQNVTIETLPDDVVLAIFTFYLTNWFYNGDSWRTLVHVCQRWRYLVFASPGHLNLRLECTIKTRAREMLDVWPPLPIAINDDSKSMEGVDNIIAALELRDRVCQITLCDIPGWKMDTLVPSMLGPFPALQRIHFAASYHGDSAMVVVPDSFLGGSAPQLQWFMFHDIPFPALPTLLSSTTNLVDLRLTGIPRSGYIPPDVLATCLSAMPRLSTFCFLFDSPESFPNGETRHHPPLECSTLPALRRLFFKGIYKYFEDLTARIDTPGIRILEITFFHQPFYDFSQLSRFIGRIEVFMSPAHVDARLSYIGAEVSVSRQTRTNESALLRIRCNEVELHLQLRHLMQVFSSSLPFSEAESLAISSAYQLERTQLEATAEDSLWLDLLHSFSAVRNLDIDENILTPVAYTLKKVVKERITDVFPAIQELSLGEDLPSGPVLRAIEKFATARGLLTRLDRPHRWVAC